MPAVTGQLVQSPPLPAGPYSRLTTYIAIIASDGDNMQVCSHPSSTQFRLWTFWSCGVLPACFWILLERRSSNSKTRNKGSTARCPAPAACKYHLSTERMRPCESNWRVALHRTLELDSKSHFTGCLRRIFHCFRHFISVVICFPVSVPCLSVS